MGSRTRVSSRGTCAKTQDEANRNAHQHLEILRRSPPDTDVSPLRKPASDCSSVTNRLSDSGPSPDQLECELNLPGGGCGRVQQSRARNRAARGIEESQVV